MIRRATINDLSSLLPLLQQLFSIEKDFIFDAKKQMEGLLLLLRSQHSVIMVAEEKCSIIGMASAQLVISTAEGRASILLEDVVMTPSWQRQGIGSELLKSLGVWGEQHGASRMQLLADKTNQQALDFYSNRGWQTTQLICLRK